VEPIIGQILTRSKFSAMKSWACVLCVNKHNKPLVRGRTKNQALTYCKCSDLAEIEENGKWKAGLLKQ